MILLRVQVASRVDGVDAHAFAIPCIRTWSSGDHSPFVCVCVCVCVRARALSQEELYNAVSNAGDLWGKKKYNGHVRTLCISVFNAIAQTHCDL